MKKEEGGEYNKKIWALLIGLSVGHCGRLCNSLFPPFYQRYDSYFTGIRRHYYVAHEHNAGLSVIGAVRYFDVEERREIKQHQI
jgi:hypothetical protein